MKKETKEFEAKVRKHLEPHFKITERKDGLLRYVEAEGPTRISMCFLDDSVLLNAEIDGTIYNTLDVIYLKGTPYPEKKKYLDNLGKILYEIRQVTNG